MSSRVHPVVPSRHVVIASGVVLFHVVALWALQTGLLKRVAEVLVPVVLLSEILEPPRPNPETSPPPRLARPTEQAKPTAINKAAPQPPPPLPLAVADPAPATHAPTGVVTPPAPLPQITVPVASTPGAGPTAPPPPRLELPSSDADYLQNPALAYPVMSKRLGEQGKVVVRVLIGIDGTAQKAEIRQSSGFERLDQAALATAQRWRYVPGKRGGVIEAMWFNVPINFILE